MFMRFTCGALLLASVLVTATAVEATVYFQDTGTKTGWSNYPQHPQNKGRIDVVSSPVYKGSTALRFEQTYDPAWTAQGGGYHSEVVKTAAQRLGQDRYYGGALYLPSNWNFIDKNTTFWQFSPESPSGPWNLNWVQKNEIRIRVMGTHYTLGTLSAGVWQRPGQGQQLVDSGQHGPDGSAASGPEHAALLQRQGLRAGPRSDRDPLALRPHSNHRVEERRGITLRVAGHGTARTLPSPFASCLTRA